MKPESTDNNTEHFHFIKLFLLQCQNYVFLAESLRSLPISQENYVHFTEPVGSLPCSQQPSTGPWPKPCESDLNSPLQFKIRFNLANSSAPEFSKRSFSSDYSHLPKFVYMNAWNFTSYSLYCFMASYSVQEDILFSSNMASNCK